MTVSGLSANKVPNSWSLDNLVAKVKAAPTRFVYWISAKKETVELTFVQRLVSYLAGIPTCPQHNNRERWATIATRVATTGGVVVMGLGALYAASLSSQCAGDLLQKFKVCITDACSASEVTQGYLNRLGAYMSTGGASVASTIHSSAYFTAYGLQVGLEESAKWAQRLTSALNPSTVS